MLLYLIQSFSDLFRPVYKTCGKNKKVKSNSSDHQAACLV